MVFHSRGCLDSLMAIGIPLFFACLFVQFGLDGTIFWSNGADVAPEYLFENGTDA